MQRIIELLRIQTVKIDGGHDRLNTNKELEEEEKIVYQAEEEETRKEEERIRKEEEEKEKNKIEKLKIINQKQQVFTAIKSLKHRIDEIARKLEMKKKSEWNKMKQEGMQALTEEKVDLKELKDFKDFNYSLQSFLKICKINAEVIKGDEDIVERINTLFTLENTLPEVMKSSEMYKKILSASLTAAFEQYKTYIKDQGAEPKRFSAMR